MSGLETIELDKNVLVLKLKSLLMFTPFLELKYQSLHYIL